MRQAILVAGLGYGDEGKGTMVDYLAREIDDTHTVVRFNGGAQAAHNVVTPEGVHHTFAQFGSGTFVRKVGTHLSRFMLVNPLLLLEEGNGLAGKGVADVFKRITIDARAPIITPYHRAANWLREIVRGAGAHGTCGMGIGEVMQDVTAKYNDVLLAGDLLDARQAALKVRSIQHRKINELAVVRNSLPQPLTAKARHALQVLDSPDVLTKFLSVCKTLVRDVRIVPNDYEAELFSQDGTVIFEGAQGVLLDEWYGFHPHTTWSTTTFANADALLIDAELPGVPTKRLGVLRSYATRHGEGPLVSEDISLRRHLSEAHNKDDGWQGEFRMGWFDTVATRYAIGVAGGIDTLAVTHLDEVPWQWETLPIVTCYHPQPRWTVPDLEPYFQTAKDAVWGTEIQTIKVPDRPDLDRQARLTELLFGCVGPLWQYKSDDYLPLLEEHLGVSIGLTSCGPTANDKEVRGQPIFV